MNDEEMSFIVKEFKSIMEENIKQQELKTYLILEFDFDDRYGMKHTSNGSIRMYNPETFEPIEKQTYPRLNGLYLIDNENA